MEEQIERWQCKKCLVAYRIAEAPRDKTERLKCSDCGKSFWCSTGQKTVVTMGMEHRPE